jgi:hypothetical protein
MAAPPLSVPESATQAWRDIGAVLRSLRPLTLTAFLIASGLALVKQFVVLPDFDGASPETGALLAGFIESGVQASLLTPYMIAVHRFIILGEVTQRYQLAPRAPRFQLFFLWSLALSLGYWVPSFALAALPGVMPYVALAGVGLFVIAVAAVIISFRLMILFPALAVDAPGATWDNALADSKGQVWRMLFITLLSGLPAGIALIVVLAMAASVGLIGEGTPGATGVLLSALLEGAVSTLGLTLAVAIASRLYEQLGDRVNRA